MEDRNDRGSAVTGTGTPDSYEKTNVDSLFGFMFCSSLKRAIFGESNYCIKLCEKYLRVRVMQTSGWAVVQRIHYSISRLYLFSFSIKLREFCALMSD